MFSFSSSGVQKGDGKTGKNISCWSWERSKIWTKVLLCRGLFCGALLGTGRALGERLPALPEVATGCCAFEDTHELLPLGHAKNMLVIEIQCVGNVKISSKHALEEH